MRKHNRLKELALEAIQNVFSDTDVPQSTTRESLEELREDIQCSLNSLCGAETAGHLQLSDDDWLAAEWHRREDMLDKACEAAAAVKGVSDA